jgi:Rieske 2Fe-2S family protein
MESGRKALERLEPGLPAGWYRDPAHYERELEVFWYRRWVAVAREEEIPGPGDWRLITLGSQSVVLLRNGSGELRGFHNTCRHRGSVLCTQAQGSFPRGRIVCPYHAWTYDLEGRLVGTPRRMATPDFRAEDFPLHKVAVDTWGGFVFVNLAKDPPPLRDAVSHRQERYERYRFEDLRIGKRIVADVQANWKLLAENFSECFHCPPVHPELCAVVTAYQEAGAWGLRDGPEEKPQFTSEAKTLTLDGTSRLPPFKDLNEAEKQNLYVADMLPPGLFLNVQPDYVNSQLMFPTGPQSVRIVYDWLFEPRHLPLPESDLAHYVALWDITNRQDARNCEWQQQGMQSRAFQHGVYVPQEFDAHRFAQWVRAGLRDAQG